VSRTYDAVLTGDHLAVRPMPRSPWR